MFVGGLSLHLIVGDSAPSLGRGRPWQQKAQGKGSQRRLEPTLGLGGRWELLWEPSYHTTLFHIISETSALGHNLMLSPLYLREWIQETSFKKYHWMTCKTFFKDIGHYITQRSLIRISHMIYFSQDLMTGKMLSLQMDLHRFLNYTVRIL